MWATHLYYRETVDPAEDVDEHSEDAAEDANGMEDGSWRSAEKKALKSGHECK